MGARATPAAVFFPAVPQKDFAEGPVFAKLRV